MTLESPVEGEQELVIYDPIYVVPAILVFPWIPISGEYYRYQLQVCKLQVFSTMLFV